MASLGIYRVLQYTHIYNNLHSIFFIPPLPTKKINIPPHHHHHHHHLYSIGEVLKWALTSFFHRLHSYWLGVVSPLDLKLT